MCIVNLSRYNIDFCNLHDTRGAPRTIDPDDPRGRFMKSTYLQYEYDFIEELRATSMSPPATLPFLPQDKPIMRSR